MTWESLKIHLGGRLECHCGPTSLFWFDTIFWIYVANLALLTKLDDWPQCVSQDKSWLVFWSQADWKTAGSAGIVAEWLARTYSCAYGHRRATF